MFVSIIMPIHNREPFVREAVTSVLAQTHRDLELVAVDDGSSDDTLAILQEFAAADARLRAVTQARGGIARARNRALREARAEWVVNLDHDDVMLPNRVERQIAFIGTHPDVKVFTSTPRAESSARPNASRLRPARHSSVTMPPTSRSASITPPRRCTGRPFSRSAAIGRSSMRSRTSTSGTGSPSAAISSCSRKRCLPSTGSTAAR
jgi:glycosyltransferase involved in cell wall biosynthesis